MVSEIGLNFEALRNLQTLSLNVSNTSQGILSDVVSIPNSITNNWLGHLILIGLTFAMYWALTDKTPFQDFGYDDARGWCIAFGISSLLGITMIQINFITDFTAVTLVIILHLIVLSQILFYENKGAVD